jgi:hypothetical protein
MAAIKVCNYIAKFNSKASYGVAVSVKKMLGNRDHCHGCYEK